LEGFFVRFGAAAALIYLEIVVVEKEENVFFIVFLDETKGHTSGCKSRC